MGVFNDELAFDLRIQIVEFENAAANRRYSKRRVVRDQEAALIVVNLTVIDRNSGLVFDRNRRIRAAADSTVEHVALSTINGERYTAAKRSRARTKTGNVIDRRGAVEIDVASKARIRTLDHRFVGNRQLGSFCTLDGIVAKCKEHIDRLRMRAEIDAARVINTQRLRIAEGIVNAKGNLSPVLQPGLAVVRVVACNGQHIALAVAAQNEVACCSAVVAINNRSLEDIAFFLVGSRNRQTLPQIVVAIGAGGNIG